MVASAFHVTFNPSVNVGSRNGVQGAVVWAETAQDAKDILECQYGSDVDSGWENATVTALAAATNMLGWRMRVIVATPELEELYDIEVTNTGSNDTIDELGALMVTALEAAGGAALTPSYASNVLTVAAIADDIGDHHIVVEIYPPEPATRTHIPGYVGAIVDEGVAGAVLTAAMCADVYTIANVVKKFQTTEAS